MVRVLPDEVGIDKTFDYVVPPRWRDPVEVGTRVRIALGPRRVGGWVVATDVAPVAGVDIRYLAKHSGRGPGADLIEVAQWARWRWAARSPVPFLRTASPHRNVIGLPPPARRPVTIPVPDPTMVAAFAEGVTVLRLPPVADRLPVVEAAAARGDALIICPSRLEAKRLASRLRRTGVPVAVHPDDWARAAAGGSVVIGTRAAAWAPVPDLAAVVVLDEHDEVHQEESSPTWHARDVAVERARRAGVPAVLVSPVPSLAASGTGRLLRVDRAEERAGWPATVVVDRRDEDTGRNALFSPALASVVRSGARVVCVLNQKGRAALLACARCESLARCDRCDGAVHRPDDQLVCRRCGATRPVVCADCGAVDLRTVRMGVSRVADDLEALAQEPVAEVTADTPAVDLGGHRLLVGTEAVLHRIDRADVVAFLDFDQELLAPRYQASEEALTLLVLAARIVGGRHDGGRILLQTRIPDHPVCRAAVLGDPERASEAADATRAELGLPPHAALAEVRGEAAEAFVAGIDPEAGVEVLGPSDGSWRLRAADHAALCDALAAVVRPPGRLRLAVDPPRL